MDYSDVETLTLSTVAELGVHTGKPYLGTHRINLSYLAATSSSLISSFHQLCASSSPCELRAGCDISTKYEHPPLLRVFFFIHVLPPIPYLPSFLSHQISFQCKRKPQSMVLRLLSLDDEIPWRYPFTRTRITLDV